MMKSQCASGRATRIISTSMWIYAVPTCTQKSFRLSSLTLNVNNLHSHRCTESILFSRRLTDAAECQRVVSKRRDAIV